MMMLMMSMIQYKELTILLCKKKNNGIYTYMHDIIYIYHMDRGIEN